MPDTSRSPEYDEYARYRASTPVDDGWDDATASRLGAGRYGGVEPAAGGFAGAAPSSDARRRTSGTRTGTGLPGWAAVGVLIVIAGIGGIIDQASGATIQGAFNWGLIVASLVAILIVRRSSMFAVVVSPPLVYFVASAGKLYLTSSGLTNRSALIDAASNWLVYGFPAIAAATAIVLLVAGIRMLINR